MIPHRLKKEAPFQLETNRGGKKEVVDEQARVLLFKILANSVRLRLIERLKAGERSVGELCEETGEEQTRVSHELRCLTVCGLVNQRREGKRIIYSLNRSTVLPILGAADTHAAKFAERLKGCELISETRTIQLPKVMAEPATQR